MRNLIIYSIAFFIIGCASGIGGMLRLQDRELLIHPDKPGLAYTYVEKVCKGKFIFKRCKNVTKIDFYDFNDKSVRKSLIDAGFRCKSKMRFKY